MGSYFGSSLCAVDLNQDGLSDLLVGAPMHSQLRDEGQVSVYLSKGNVSGVCGVSGKTLSRDSLSYFTTHERPTAPPLIPKVFSARLLSSASTPPLSPSQSFFFCLISYRLYLLCRLVRLFNPQGLDVLSAQMANS